MGIWYRMGNVPRAQDSIHTPSTNNIQNVNSSSSSAPLPAAPMPKYVHPNDVCNDMCDVATIVQLTINCPWTDQSLGYIWRKKCSFQL